MKKTKKELIMMRNDARIKMEQLLDKADAEKRGLTAEEQATFDELKTELDRAERSLVVANSYESDSVYEVRTDRAELAQKIRSLLKGETKAVELRAAEIATLTSTVAGATPAVVGDIIQPLEKGLIHNLVGTKVITGMAYNQKWPVAPSIEASYAEEAVKITDNALTITAVTPQPKRMAFRVAVSAASVDATDGMLLDQIVLPQINIGLTRLINNVMFKPSLVASGGNPGVFVSPGTTQSIKLATAYADIKALFGKVRAKGVQNDGTYAYVMSAQTAAQLSATSRDSGSGKMVIEDGKIDGVPVFECEYIGDNKVGFGRFSDAMVGQFGDIRLTVDEVSGAAADLIYVTINAYFAVAALRPEAFGLGTIATS